MFSAGAEVDVWSAASVPALDPAHRDRSPSPKAMRNQHSYSDLPRSASYTDVPAVQQLPRPEGVKRTFSDDLLAFRSFDSVKAGQPPQVPTKRLLRGKSYRGKQGVAVTQFTLSSDDLETTTGQDITTRPALESADKQKSFGGRSVTSTFRNLARRPWKTSSSRSPSPSPRDSKTQAKSRNTSPNKRGSRLFTSTPASASSETSTVAYRRSSRGEEVEANNAAPSRPSIRHRMSNHDNSANRPLSAIIPGNKSETELSLSKKPSLRSLRSKRSSDKLPKLPNIKVPAIPSSLSSDRLSSASLDVSKRKDPLWNVFRTLEGDFQKFQSKSSALKANVIRTCLMPFLAKYASHPSNRTLRSEDLDRRVMILNKWWTGQLEMLNGRNNQSISGTDRPVFLEGVAGVMVRPEWRIPSYPTPKPADTPPAQNPGIHMSASTTSLDSGTSDFLTESVHHNVRNMFVQNLLSQMAFVVDRMSMRSAPASLVAFCGKACAYAFFFCPGVADILVRLWRLSSESIRRVLTELGFPRGSKLGPESIEVSSRFPPAMRSLATTSHAMLVKGLRQKVPLPLGAGFIRWYGPWIGRWNGRDSDLFFAFTKHFHMLVAETYPGGVSEKKLRAAVPGFVLVHAQILTFLESTLYRQGGQHQNDMYSSSSAPDDLDSPDVAVAMPLTTANAARSMAENRLVMLLRDNLAEADYDHQSLRVLFAESFSDIMKTAARKISIYNHDACTVLCDFVEALLPIMTRYHQSSPDTTAFDWTFWFGVCQKMMESQNTLTEIRILAFLYTSWNTIIADQERRRELCLDWLLEASFFETFFNHWCPMVRAYYLRLLCWRVARVDREATELDLAIYDALMERLESSWAAYLYLKKEAEAHHQVQPSSAPCSPAPARRLVIIRSDNAAVPISMFTSFDTVLSQMSAGPSRNATISKSHGISNGHADRPAPKKRWSFIKNIMPFSAPVNARPGEVTPPASAETELGTDSDTTDALDSTSLARNSAAADPENPTNNAVQPRRPSTPPHQPFTFKFSLEWLDGPNWPSKNRRLTAPKLPEVAQASIEAWRKDSTGHGDERAGEEEADAEREIEPKKPAPGSTGSASYAGRALAEWAQIVAEYQGFFERRREEGVPTDRLVETPSLGVESFRMSG